MGVPGNVAGIDLALCEFGTMPFGTVAKRAIEIAEQGTPVTPGLSAKFAALKNIDPASRRAYFPDGVPAAGGTWKQPDLARLMRRLCEDGPSSFYTSDVAATICKQLQAGGGTLTAEDFHDFRATLEEPLHVRYRGYDLYTPPLPSGGLTCLSTLKTLEQFDLSEYKPVSAAFYNLFFDAANLAWAERDRYFGDPEFVKVPIEDLLSEKRAMENASTIRKGDVKTKPGAPNSATHTVNVVVADADQNVVSWTATHGGDFGSHVAIEGLGLMLGHGMSRFSLDPESPNYPAPRKRPQHNMSPMIVLRDGRPYAGLGLPGGTRIVSVTTQLAANLIDFKLTPQQMVSAPRVHTEGYAVAQVNRDVPEKVIDELRKLGRQVQYLDPLAGDSNAIVIDASTGQMQAAAGKRSDGAMVF